MDTSRTRPVALRVKLESCGAPVARAGVDVMRITSWARARPRPGLTGTMGHRSFRSRADDVLELTADAVALQREGEPVSPVQHARHLGRAVDLVEGGAVDLERGGTRGQLQQRRLLVPELADLDGGQRPAHLHAVQALEGGVERDRGEVLLAEVGEAGRVQPGGEQGERAVGDRGQPVQPEQPPRLALDDDEFRFGPAVDLKDREELPFSVVCEILFEVGFAAGFTIHVYYPSSR